MLKRSILFITTFLMLCVTGVQAKEWRTIRIGVEPSYPPFSMKLPNGKLAGFDIDIANALCAQLRAQCVFVESDFDSLIAGLNVRKFDVVVASLSITDDRKKVVNFTDPYYYTPSRIVVRNNTIDGSVASLKGNELGVLRGSVQHWYARDVLAKKGVIVVPYTNQNEAFLDLKAGRVEAVLADVIQAQFSFLKKPENKAFNFAGPVIVAPQYFGSGAGIALRKADNDLRLALNSALKTIRTNGVYKQIQKKYFDFDIDQVTK